MSKGSEPAFPFAIADDPISPGIHRRFDFGLTKREMFAAMAMQGLCASNFENEKQSIMSNKDVATTAVLIADDLIAELEKEK